MTTEDKSVPRRTAPDEDALQDLMDRRTKAGLPAVPPARLNMEMFPGAQDAGDRRAITAEQAGQLVRYALSYGLDAWAGHVCYMYGKPYITEKGALANAEKQPTYRGYNASMTSPEERKALRLSKEDLAWTCNVLVKERDAPVTEYGVVYDSELDQLKKQVSERLLKEMKGREVDSPTHERLVLEKLSYLPLYRRPGHQAYIRAIRRAHLVAFPLKRVSPEGEIAEEEAAHE